MLTGGQTPTAETPTGIIAMADTKLSQAAIPAAAGSTPGSWQWIEPEKGVGSTVGERTFAAMFLPADSRFLPVRAQITVLVKKPPVLRITDNAATPELEVTMEHAEAGWCMAAVYDGSRMVSAGTVEIPAGSASAAISLGEYEAKDGLTIRAFLLDQQYAPQTAPQTK